MGKWHDKLNISLKEVMPHASDGLSDNNSQSLGLGLDGHTFAGSILWTRGTKKFGNEN